MKKVLFVLIAALAIASSVLAQQFKIEKSEAFEKSTAWFRLLQMKNGNTLLFSYGRQGFSSVVYDKNRKEISRKYLNEKWKYWKLATRGIYEINGEAVLFVMAVFQPDNRLLHRIRVDGTTGEFIGDDTLGQLPKMGSLGNSATQWAKAHLNEIHVEKDPESDNYAVVFFNGSAKNKCEHIRAIHYDGSHKIVSEAFYESPNGAFKYLTYVGMTVDGSKRMFLSAYGRNGKSSDQKPRLIVSVLNAGDTSFKHNVLEFTEEFGFTRSFMLYNHSINRIQMLSLTEVKTKTNILTERTTTYYALLLSSLNPENLNIIDARFFGATKVKEYARKNIDPDFKFTAMPQDMVLNGDNTITILSEEMKDFITARGYIAVNDLTDTCSELRGYVISKVQYANQHTMLLRHSMLLYERRIGYNDDITSIDNNLGSSYTYCDAPSGRYIIFNDMDENFDKKEADTRRAALKQTSEGSAVCCKLEEGKVEKFYLYGEPKKRKATYINLEASSYDNNSHTLAALVYNADDARLENINVAWITFE